MVDPVFLAPLAPTIVVVDGGLGRCDEDEEDGPTLDVSRTLPEPLDPDARLPLGFTFCLTTATISAADSPMGSGDPLAI